MPIGPHALNILLDLVEYDKLKEENRMLKRKVKELRKKVRMFKNLWINA